MASGDYFAVSTRPHDDVMSVPSSPEPESMATESTPAHSERPVADADRPVQGPETLAAWMLENDQAFQAWCEDLLTPTAQPSESLSVSPPQKTL